VKRRTKAGGGPVKPQHRKTGPRKSRIAKARPHSPSIATLEAKVDRLTGELNEASERQRATADILSAISRSKFELQSILQSVVDTASQLCQADASVIFRLEGGVYRFAAGYSLIPSYMEHERRNPISPGPGTLIGRAASSRRVVHIEDAWTDPLYEQKAVVGVGRSMLGVPLMRKGEPIGVIGLSRSRVAPFTQREIDLVTTFADQAVIAIENVRLFEAEQQRTRELSESLEQQTATSDVLKVISSSRGDPQPVFDSILANATRVCQAQFGHLLLCEGAAFRNVAIHDAPLALAEKVRGQLFRPHPESPLAQAAITKQPVHVRDLMMSQPYLDGHPAVVMQVEVGGTRTLAAVPMLSGSDLVGIIILYRNKVHPFTDKQIELVKNFAAQAVIAIENARLLNELRESLEQQTATADVLNVISRSAFDLNSVLDTLVESAARLCGTGRGFIFLRDGDLLRLASIYGMPERTREALITTPLRVASDTAGGRAVQTKSVCFVSDVATKPDYGRSDLAEIGEYRAIIGVPLLQDGEAIGVFSLPKRDPGDFAPRQIEMLRTFADQAVVAINNARLFGEVQQRTQELTESLEHQTATSEVLRVISSSAGDLQPVFERVLDNATRLCNAKFGNLFLLRGDEFQYVASHGVPSAFTERIKQQPRGTLREHQYTPLARVARTKKVVHVADLAEDESYRKRDANIVALVDGAGARTIVVVPMFKEDHLVGAVAIYRQEVSPYADKQIELVENFAAQAVIAIENARLLNELRQSLEEQTATSDVLRVISSSPGELEPVFSAMLASATRICEAEFGNLFLRQEEDFRAVAWHGDSTYVDTWRGPALTIKIDTPDIPLARLVATNEPVHVADLRQEAAYKAGHKHLVALIDKGGARTLLIVPMVKESTLVGAIAIYRQEVRPFTDKQTALMESFAAQAVIAIENARLLNELRQRTDDLTKSLEDLRTTQDRLVQTQKLASLGQLTAGIAHEIKNPLNFVNNFSGVSVELIDELQEAIQGVQADERVRSEIGELADTLRDNLGKIVQHGKRADSIVKNMLLHSREGSGECRPVDINALVDEAVNLAYHGARAEKQTFNVTLERFLDPAAGEVDCFPQDITRVLLNLISNGFYAAAKRNEQVTDDGFEPKMTATTKNLGDRIEIKIRDNGTGIAPEVREKMFNPFFTTKPAGEGTGLGLSISHDIIVKQHSGAIEVDSEPGEYTEVRIILPRAAAGIAAGQA
jgi:GAF domain-containing protein